MSWRLTLTAGGTAWHACAHESCPACADGDAEAVATTRIQTPEEG